MTMMFDYPKVAAEIGLSSEQLQALEQRIRQDFPHDDMLFELHVLRACLALQEGRVTLEEVLRPEPVTAPFHA
jgi:hypothetical protein